MKKITSFIAPYEIILEGILVFTVPRVKRIVYFDGHDEVIGIAGKDQKRIDKILNRIYTRGRI